MKFAYLIVQEDFTIEGTNDEEKALAWAEFAPVVDIEAGKRLDTGDEIYEAAEVEDDD